MPTLSLDNLSKTYRGGVEALRGVTLQAPDGRYVVLVGPSGSGKSTLLRLVAGLERPTTGGVLLDGQSIDRLPPHRRDVAMVFQQPTLYPYLTVRQNLGHGLKRLGLDRAAIGTRVGHAAAMLGVVPLLDRRPQQLSGGEAQRVALGRALARRPGVLLLDEPLSSLDAALRTQLRGELRKLHGQLGATTLHVTHDQAEALSLAELLVVVHEGRMLQSGPPMNLYHRPANQFVAGFLGNPGMNLWPGRIEGGRFAADNAPLTAHAAADHSGAATLGVRPERLRLNEPAGAPLGAGQVTALEPLGPDALAHVSIGALAAVARVPLPCRLTPGEEVSLTADAEDLHWFEPGAAGARIE
ncbi:sn-glycerol-3-phosphate import ATP-binding protein UgpC [Posidoniimonas corsicana]|uniref:sn-glycerol-3-phosphate import ATP-binding protein UgpC n=1 Tax=Posidoniimonas corsicana TaxID=1938618 RepID=A0A5C5V2Q6_9BACT|nr:ATP-binding cassette domain-containing protein [Posidoniimonas corsicana]TWT32223.1 sn-glycerol-3-phosphate import ATP-binding protein UgpC [Posidoniimonas corsicana]